MDLVINWTLIRNHFKRSISTNFHVSIASVDENNHPSATPIGSLFLNKDLTGYYFEKFVTKLPLNAHSNNNVCVLSVNSGLKFWCMSLFKSKFKYPPAIKLYGTLGTTRKATKVELEKLHRRLKPFRLFKKGYSELWGGMAHVREIKFNNAEIINLGKTTSHLNIQ